MAGMLKLSKQATDLGVYDDGVFITKPQINKNSKWDFFPFERRIYLKSRFAYFV